MDAVMVWEPDRKVPVPAKYIPATVADWNIGVVTGMGYRIIEKGMWGRVFAVPNQLVDQHLKLSGEIPLKVLLLMLRHEQPLSEEELLALVGKATLQDIRDALAYWEERGILAPEKGSREAPSQAAIMTATLEPSPQTQSVVPFPAPDLQPSQESQAAVLSYTREEESGERAAQKVKVVSKGRMRLHTGDVNQMARDDENVSFLLQESQQILGKPLNAVASDTIVSLYSYYGMAPDLVLMLLQYCVTLQRDSMSYVEKVAADWIERGIDTHEKAEQEILRATQRRSMEGKVKAAFGIYDRKLVSKEKRFIQVWHEEFGYDLKIISMAFERSVELKGSLSFDYINGILKNWHEKGVRTLNQAAKELQNKPEKPGTQLIGRGSRDASYDIGELEQMIRQRGASE